MRGKGAKSTLLKSSSIAGAYIGSKAEQKRKRIDDKKSPTFDEMVQAARSAKQNILKGSEASGTSKETEIKLTGVAKASQKELLEDYRDFMRNRGIEEWSPNHPYALRLRRLNRTPDANYQTFQKASSTKIRRSAQMSLPG